jgi:hypothetical protein
MGDCYKQSQKQEGDKGDGRLLQAITEASLVLHFCLYSYPPLLVEASRSNMPDQLWCRCSSSARLLTHFRSLAICLLPILTIVELCKQFEQVWSLEEPVS